ncbi:MAG: tRNA (adenosine(37)-N6)-threonylcarbamoyltransferase complex ATPase subunit type 1 TsaE [Patescibacteria group bacterium]
MEKIVTKNEVETFNLGQKLAKKCHGGEVFVLNGDLGAGKTKLLQGLAKGLGVRGRVNSPTFNIIKVYKTGSAAVKLKNKAKFFCHIDAYRLKSGKDLKVLGVEEFFNSSDTVTAIEWGERVKSVWPQGAVVIEIRQISGNSREIIVK